MRVRFDCDNLSVSQFEVPLNAGQRSNPKKVSVKIAFVRKVNVGLLDRLLKGEGTKDDLRPEGDVSTTLNMLNVFIQAMPKVLSRKVLPVAKIVLYLHKNFTTQCKIFFPRWPRSQDGSWAGTTQRILSVGCEYHTEPNPCSPFDFQERSAYL